MTSPAKTIAALFPFLTVAVLLWSASCSRAQVPPVEAQMASLIDWRVILRQATTNLVQIGSKPIVRWQLEYRLPPHWCQTPENTAFYYSEPPYSTWTLVETNVFTPDRPCRLFIGWHWCHTNDTGRQCEVRLAKL